MKSIKIKPGKFLMGSPETEIGRYSDEKQREVVIADEFEIGENPVTQKQWISLMGRNPSHFKGTNLPVENVSWDDCQNFLKKMNDKHDGYTYSLPTEAQWEYACRAGSTTAYCFGDNETLLCDYAWYYRNSENTTHPVKLKKPNAWGLYDMHGNIWEWCQDLYESGSYRVLRGGGWANFAQYVRSAYRYRGTPGDRRSDVGFRLVRTKALHSNPVTLDSESAKRDEALREINKIRAKLSKLERLLK